MGIATIDVLLMHCLEWTSHVSVHANLKVPIEGTAHVVILSLSTLYQGMKKCIIFYFDQKRGVYRQRGVHVYTNCKKEILSICMIIIVIM